MSGYIIRTAMLLAFLIIIKSFAWPDITSYFGFLQDGVNKIYFMNAIMDMDTAFTLVKFSLSIEILFLSYKIIMGIVQFIGSGSFGNKDSTPEEL